MDNAYFAYQTVGMQPSLCEADSAWTLEYSSCLSCIQYNATDPAGASTYLEEEFAPPIDYCAALARNVTVVEAVAASQSIGASQSSALALLSSQIGAASTLASLISEYKSLQSENERTTLQTSFPSSSFPTTTLQITSPSSPSSTTTAIQQTSSSIPSNTSLPSAQHKSSQAWIAGPVVGALVLFLAGICLILRQRRKKRDAESSKSLSVGGEQDKAQLHGDSLVVQRHGLASGMMEKTELEAKEKVNELPG